jgi:glycosyltransferase involved in cell wall biosynthesis
MPLINDYLVAKIDCYRDRRNRIRQAVKIAADAVIIFSVTKLVEQEDLSTLKHRFAELLGNHPYARLVLVGDRPVIEDIKNGILEKSLSKCICHDFQYPWDKTNGQIRNGCAPFRPVGFAQ